MVSSFTKLRQLRKINEITLSEVSAETGLSIGYLNRIERGYISDIKNLRKKERLIQYIDQLKQTTKQNHTLDENLFSSSSDKAN